MRGDEASVTKPIAFVIPGDIETLSGGYGYARAVMAAWRAAGVPFEHIVLPGDYPFPSTASLEETERTIALIDPDQPILIDGLAYGAIPRALIDRLQRRFVVLLHHPLGLETGLDETQAKALIESEKAAVDACAHVVVTSAETARTVVDLFDVAESAVTVAVPGTKRRPRAIAGSTPMILSLGSLTPRKGHLDLIAALARLKEHDWTAHIVGSASASPQTANDIRQAIAAKGLEDRIHVPGALGGEELDGLFARASIFALASYYEGYGMAFAEAMAAGLPIVGYRAGAVPDLVPAEAGTLVAPGDIDALTEALGALIRDGAHRERLADGAYRVGQSLPDWPETAALINDTVRQKA
ncbi:glycosyltransferase family 1 protein [Georhizobium profundi]|uniref:Glycosyltransferase family 1 protein n=1 Tax=Georhizobium profundi TaxID=2341112 RepID=A0A3Q8XM03_9HYPH|nr:glycosyltransferase family 1 protein [Georhizobium profundi]